MGQYSSLPPVCVRVHRLRVSLSLTLTANFDPFEISELYFYKECVTVSLFLHYGPSLYDCTKFYGDFVCCDQLCFLRHGMISKLRINTGQSKVAADEGKERKEKRRQRERKRTSYEKNE